MKKIKINQIALVVFVALVILGAYDTHYLPVTYVSVCMATGYLLFFVGGKKDSSLTSTIGKKVIVRANTAGVHAGIVTEIDTATKSVVLKDACRLWRVYTRDKSGSISDIAANGLKEPLNQHSIGAKLLSVLIINNEGLEIAEMTNAAYESVLAASPKEK